jgi:hypothetical protein
MRTVDRLKHTAKHYDSCLAPFPLPRGNKGAVASPRGSSTVYIAVVQVLEALARQLTSADVAGPWYNCCAID